MLFKEVKIKILLVSINLSHAKGFPGGSDGKESACNVRDLGSMPGLGRSPLWEGMLTHSHILAWRISMGRGAWRVIVHGVEKSRTQLND